MYDCISDQTVPIKDSNQTYAVFLQDQSSFKLYVFNYRYDALLGAKDNWEELCSRFVVKSLSVILIREEFRPRRYKTFFILNSTEHEISTAHLR